jgi:lipopolysaccharide export system permease protein
MKIIVNYIGINILKGVCLVAGLLLAVDLFFYLINELRFIGTGNYDLIAAIKFIILTIPRKLYIMSPWSALIGTLLVLGSMAKNSELVTMRASGISANTIALFGSYYILLFTVVVFIAGELLAPKIESFAQQQKTLALSQGKAIYTAYGTWIRNGNKFVHVEIIKDQDTLSNVTIYELDQNFRLKQSRFAKIAKFIKNDYWELSQVIITDFNNNKIIKNIVPSLKEKNLLDLHILQASSVKHLERLSISSLYIIIKERIANNLTVIEYKIAFWRKIIQPFSILIMSYLAVPFVLGPLRSCSRGLRLLIGIILGFIFYLLNALFCPLASVIHIPPSIAVMLPPIIFLSLSVYLAIKI